MAHKKTFPAAEGSSTGKTVTQEAPEEKQTNQVQVRADLSRWSSGGGVGCCGSVHEARGCSVFGAWGMLHAPPGEGGWVGEGRPLKTNR